MVTSLCRKAAGCALAAAVMMGGAVYATDVADTARTAADEASRRIDADLQATARDLTAELATPNHDGMQATIDQANEQLAWAQQRDRYTMQRRELQNNQSLYYPGSPRFEEFNDRIRQLDQDFSARDTAWRNNRTQSDTQDTLASQW